MARLSPTSFQRYSVKIATKGCRVIAVIEKNADLEEIASHGLKPFESSKIL